MRPTCIECVAKHVGSALVLLSETLHGYPEHLIFAIGELEQAVQECECDEPALSEKIREARKIITSEVPRALTFGDIKNRTALISDLASMLATLRQEITTRLMQAAAEGTDITPGANV